MKRFFSLAVLAAVFLVAFSGVCFAASNKLTIAGFASDTVDMQMTTSEYFVPLNAFDRLVQIQPGSNPPKLVPMLAEKWTASPDGKVFTFYLRKGVKFHNGEEMTADDVIYTVERILNPATKSVQTDLFDFLVGAKDRLDGKAKSVAGLKKIDKYTVQMTLAQPYAPFIASMGTPGASIISKNFTQKWGSKFGQTAASTCGTGPFVLKEYVLNDHFTLVANKDYWAGKPQIDELLARIVPDAETMRMMFTTGEIDIFDCDQAFTQIPYFQQDPKWKNAMMRGPRVGVVYMAYNNTMKPFDDVRVRKAFQMAIDREAILKSVYFGNGKLNNGVTAPGTIGYNPGALPKIEYNPKKAKELLAQAGYPNGCDIVLTQVSGWSNRWVQINELIQQMVKEAGFNVKLEAVDSATYYARRREGKIMAYPQVWSLDANDPDSTFYNFFYKERSAARSINYSNAAAMQKIIDLRFMADQKARLAGYVELEKQIVHDDAAWLPLFSLDHLWVLQPRVKSFVVPWNGWSDMSYYPMAVSAK